MENPHEVQVVSMEEDHSYRLNEAELEKILMNEGIKDLPVALVSVAGAYRGGKSFILNFFIRYLSSSPTARADGTWLGEENQELTGFVWRGGSTRVTTGIVMWSQPFEVTLASGQKVAVLFLDTQGTFDNMSSVKDCSTVFALSSLVSSTQIYNLRSQISEDDLQNLQLFTSYGQLMNKEHGKAFQVLEFLIRDWMNPWEYAYGIEGGEKYIKNKLQTNPSQPAEIRDLRNRIQDSFEKVTCFLMPHPGYAIANPDFKGTTKEIAPNFSIKLNELATSILSPEQLCIKKIGGHAVKCGEMFHYFKSYMSLFNSNTLPTPRSILQVTADAGLMLVTQKIREEFEKNIERDCGSAAPSMPASAVTECFQKELALARSTFAEKKILGDKEDISKKFEKLIEELRESQNEYIERNRLKTLNSIKNGNEAYQNYIDAITKDKPLCVNPLDLPEIHNEAVKAAFQAFDANRRLGSDGHDSDREKYAQDLSHKYEVLNLTNDQNNKVLVVELKSAYMDYIIAQANSQPNQCEVSFENKHEIAEADALKKFEARRNKPSSHDIDVYKSNLKQGISNVYLQAKNINQDKGQKALRVALSYYIERSLNPSYISYGNCYHPNTLRSRHEVDKSMVYSHIYPLQVCDSNKQLLESEMERLFEETMEINKSANYNLISRAYWAYREKFDELSGKWYWAFVSWKTAREYHNEAFEIGENFFYKRRVTGRYEYHYDEFFDEYRRRCDEHWYSI